MNRPERELQISRLAELLGNAQRVLVFTGAGISTGSHIPDYRGPDGVWKTKTPVLYDEFRTDPERRKAYWEYKLESFPIFRAAKPNRTHLAIVELERLGKVGHVVTQNIDGLHAAAGTSREKLIELHGTAAEVECDSCKLREQPERCMHEFERTREPPVCPSCGGFMRPAVIMFGQNLNLDDLGRARISSRDSDLVIALGSSLVVTPAADVPLVGVQRGVRYVIVNRGETPHDRLASLRVDDDVAEIFPPAVERLRLASS
jgi:NAD-dependent deacetylase